MMKKKDKRREGGMITVEAVLSLVPFIMVIMGIISFINIFLLHNKIQYAMYQAGSELASYTYLYQALGIRQADLDFQADADRETQEIDATIESTTNFLDQLSSLDESVGELKSSSYTDLGANIEKTLGQGEVTLDAFKQAYNDGMILISDPKDLLRNLVYFGAENVLKEIKSFLLSIVAAPMVEGYLNVDIVGSDGSVTTKMTADEYLLKAGVIDGINGLDYSASELFSDPQCRMIDIVVEYDVRLFFFEVLFIDPKVHVVQRCAVPAWINGDGVTIPTE